MGRLRDLLKRLNSGRPVEPVAAAERLRIEFKARYHSFKLLLEANHKALEIMAELDETLRGLRPFGMTFVRARCTRVTTQVWQMTKRLDELAPGKYAALQGRFKSIREEVNRIVEVAPRSGEGSLVLPLGEVTRALADRVGGKMAELGEVHQRRGIEIPHGFVVTARGFRRFMEHNELQTEIDRRLQAAGAEQLDHLAELSGEIRELIARAEIPGDLEQAIREQYALLEQVDGEGVAVAVRSSALGEDLPGASFAGQHDSQLNVAKGSLFDAYRAVVASKYSLPAMTYRLSRGNRDENEIMCVGVLSMVDAVAGGVLYTRNPVDSADDSVIVSATWGLPVAVVEGSVAADLWTVARGNPPEVQRRTIARKRMKAARLPDEGVCHVELSGEEGARPSLTDEQVLELARLGLRLEEDDDAPQDLEWALDRDGRIVLLQCRRLPLVQAPGSKGERAEAETASAAVVLRGTVTASPGAAAGPAFAVRTEPEALQFPEGSVLVTVQPLPRWATLLSRAVAVVSEQGSVAGHLANVAREFGVPALFGAEGAVERLRRGQVVTVDADGHAVLEGRVEALLARTEPPRNPMADSPVHAALAAAARHITPLNLLDPDGAGFTGEQCATLHDITRFCHEKAVQEMFRFGRDHHFPERSSKQLYCDVPMQWWVLNLDDGFGEEVGGKYVRLESIASIPMLAVWEGITAIPWEGPPPIDGKGFLSVILEATANADLASGRRSRYADRNYFMVSKNYCCLTSRLGAHFSIIEAMVGERTGENYVSFQFKGGAADYDRRLKRVFFVKEILEEYGFRVALNRDNVIARLEGYDKEFMQGRLRILGYLTIHTRQLDMIMSSPSSVGYYREKIHEDIRSILARS
jgi:pyruvate,water dikinase